MGEIDNARFYSPVWFVAPMQFLIMNYSIKQKFHFNNKLISNILFSLESSFKPEWRMAVVPTTKKCVNNGENKTQVSQPTTTTKTTTYSSNANQCKNEKGTRQDNIKKCLYNS